MQSLRSFAPFAFASTDLDGVPFINSALVTVAAWLRSERMRADVVAFIRSRLPKLAWTLFGGKIERVVVDLIARIAALVDPATADPKAP